MQTHATVSTFWDPHPAVHMCGGLGQTGTRPRKFLDMQFIAQVAEIWETNLGNLQVQEESLQRF